MRDPAEYRQKAAEFAAIATQSGNASLKALYEELTIEYRQIADAIERLQNGAGNGKT